MSDHSIESLAAKIAEIEATGAGRSRGPRSRSAVVASRSVPGAQDDRAEQRPRASAEGSPVGGATEPALPTRDVDDERGPSLVDLAGQLAHDEALGVGPDGRPLDAGEDDAARRRRRKPKVAQLAFSEPEPFARALELAYKIVAQREHTARQLREKLAKKGCEAAEIRGAIAELERHGFLDDRRYARVYAEDKRRLQGWGRRRIELELGRAGVSREIVGELFADDEAALDAPSELEVALDLLRRKQPDLTDDRVKARMAGMLARRGIASGTVFAALRAYGAGADADGR